jgi:hypothetical protein
MESSRAPPTVQRSRLVEQNGARPRHRLERAAALDQNSTPSGLSDASNERNRRCQNERTRSHRHQDRKAANKVA